MSYQYPSGYAPKSISDQVKILKKYFKKLKQPLEYPAMPEGAEGCFVIPHWKTLGTYQEAVDQAWKWISDSRSTYKWLDTKNLRQGEKKAKMWETAGDVLILPCQLGQKYAGKSMQEAQNSFQKHEIGLGAYEGLIIALTHPERFQKWDELEMDLPGDEYDYPGDGVRFGHGPCLCFGSGLKFGTHGRDRVSELFGSVSAFAPQANLDLESLTPFESSTLTLYRAIAIVKENGYKIIKEI